MLVTIGRGHDSANEFEEGLAASSLAAEAVIRWETGMGGKFVEYQLVRIAKLLREPHDCDGWKINQRSPAVGDVGTLLDVLRAQAHPERYVVECTGLDGTTIWLDDFDAGELEGL